MYIGSQFGHQTDEEIQVLSQLGVINVDQTPVEAWKDWTTDALVALKERWAKHGISLEMLHIPLGSRSAYDNEAGAIFLKPSDERDRQIDWMKETVRMAGEAGIRGLNYNITILGHLRTPAKTGRGGATVSTFELDKLDQSAAEFEDGPADENEMWERINHWLQEIIPVAEEYKVQMACHPSDPGIGVGNTYRGVARPLGMVDGFKQLIELYDSP
ncbi:uncharacterized protein METZ01_LOCUS254998, partial [marine metagenome]